MNDSVGRCLIQLIHRQSVNRFIPLTALVLFIGFLLSRSTEGNPWIYWTILALTVASLRVYLPQYLDRFGELEIQDQLFWQGVLSVALGIAIGSCVLFFPQLDLISRFIVSLLIVGFVGGIGVYNAGYPPLYLCIALPCACPLGIVWLANPGGYIEFWMTICMVSLLILLIVMVSISGKETFDTFSSQVKLSEQYLATSEELEKALARAELEQERAEASNRSKTRFLAAASHDLRQPVHVVSLFGAALSTMSKERRVCDVVTDMNSAIESLSLQLEALLDVSKLDSGTVEPEFQSLDIQTLINCIVGELRADADRKGIFLVSRITTPIHVLSDSNMLLQILRNLIGNAIKYTNHGGVTISSDMDSYRVVLKCEDSGIGVSACDMKYIIEEFYQVDNPERNRINGLGLGLSIVDRLVKCLSHDLTIESTLGSGTKVALCLDRASVSSCELENEVEISGTCRIESRFDAWVHLVDDEKAVIKSMSALLTELGCRVTATSTTPETIKFLKVSRPDVVFVDYRLQGSDSGIMTLNAIAGISSDLRCVMITGDTFSGHNQARLKQRVQVLSKPVSKAKIVEILVEMFGPAVLAGRQPA